MTSTRTLFFFAVSLLLACSTRSSDRTGTDGGHGSDGGHADGATLDASHLDGGVGMDASSDSGHATDLGSTDGARPDMDCSTVDCGPTPPGCTVVADGSCCGRVVCPDAGIHDAGRDMCIFPPCAAPPPGCMWVGAGCGTCGMLVCAADAGCGTTSCPPPIPGCRLIDPCTCEFACVGGDGSVGPPTDAGGGCLPVICPPPRPGCVVDPCSCAETCGGTSDGGGAPDCRGTGCPPGTICEICLTASYACTSPGIPCIF